MRALKTFTDNLEATVKVGIIAGIGDRRVEDNNEMGGVAAEMFDEIIIRQDKRLRGKTEEELIKMLSDGIKKKDPVKSFFWIALKTKIFFLHYTSQFPYCAKFRIFCQDHLITQIL